MTSAVIFAKALADSTRIRVVRALAESELCVCELCDALEVTQSTLSTHLTLLRKGGIVQTRKEGKWIYYALSEEFEPLARQFLGMFADLSSDQRMVRDARRLKKRLKLRENGCCNLGFNQI